MKHCPTPIQNPTTTHRFAVALRLSLLRPLHILQQTISSTRRTAQKVAKGSRAKPEGGKSTPSVKRQEKRKNVSRRKSDGDEVCSWIVYMQSGLRLSSATGGGAQWRRDFERIWTGEGFSYSMSNVLSSSTEYESEMRRRGIKVYYCSNCNAVHAVPLNNDPGSEQAHMRGQQQYPSPPQQRSPYTPQQRPPSPPQQHSPSPQQHSTSPKQHSPSPPRQQSCSSPQKHWWSSPGVLGTAVVLVLLWLFSSWDNLKM